MGARTPVPGGLSDNRQPHKDETRFAPRPSSFINDTQVHDGFLDLGDRGYREDTHEPHIRIRIIGHASPRWRSATSANISDQKNFDLAMRRASTVKSEIEKLLRVHSTLQFVEFAVSLQNEDGTVAVQSSSHGSLDTLKEARNDRSDNHSERRRVDVYFEVRSRKTGEAGVCVPVSYRTTRTREWFVSVDMSAGGAFGASGQMIKLTLINGRSKEEMQGTVWAAGGGAKAAIGANYSIWSDPVPFTTKEEINFEDFRNVPVRYTALSATLFVGYEVSYISFIGLGPRAQSIYVGSWNTGTIGLGASVNAGPYRPDGDEPPTRIPIKGSDEATVPFERRDSMRDLHQVRFATNETGISPVEAALLDSFVRSILN